MRTFVILSEKFWHKKMFSTLNETFKDDRWILIDKKSEFTLENLNFLKPEKIFIPHWSHIIPRAIYEKYDCIVFHMTDLPFGRGGSPLQNLIAKGFSTTKISALRVEKGIDTGAIYLKKPLELYGTAKEIFLRSTFIIEEMISEIILNELKPRNQEGQVIEFKRRKPEDGNLLKISGLDKMYDFIRMLDCEGYPNAYIESDNFRFEFTRASLISEKEIIADVRIIKK